MQTNMFDRVLGTLEKFLEKDGWNGWDPYDGLNSSFLKALTFNKRLLRIAATQAMKRSPINFRPLLGVPKTKNPKALGLIANAYLMRYKNGHKEQYMTKAQEILDWLIVNCSAGYSGYCWGYNFDWQSSVFYLTKGVPTIVNTSFIANSFLDAYEMTKDKCYLDVARSSCDFVLNDLNRTLLTHSAKRIEHTPLSSVLSPQWERGRACPVLDTGVRSNDNNALNELNVSNDAFCFSYSPLDTQCVHNANLFAAELLARIYHFTGEENLRRSAESSLAFSLSEQNPDGSWHYNQAEEGTYIDSFHTGFVLVSLANLANYLDMVNKNEFKCILMKGYEYYKKTFFGENGMPRYYSNSVYPIDLHCSAQGIITFIKFAERDRDAIARAREIASWAIKNMWNDKEGHFYFQKLRLLTNHHLTNKIPYLRWPNAWMYYALALLAQHGAEG